MGEKTAGIYINPKSHKVRRIGIGVRPPSTAEWVQVSDDPNMSLLVIREEARKKQLTEDPDAIQWDL